MNNVGETMLEDRMQQLQEALSTTNISDYQIESFDLTYYYEIKGKDGSVNVQMETKIVQM
ncbi:hypothetical protein [Gracilibacillus xinjiangensis]|uniref:Uncharacterized protein n=1 Tax=Gracilibacillus xinjiangensis TaxID=1193282 RepID=A0ABV8WU01_9BACI